jgi:hypothetical protein
LIRSSRNFQSILILGVTPSSRASLFFHSIDYLAYPRKSRTLRQDFRKASPSFQIVDEIAHAFKHVDTGGRTPLKADKVMTHKGGFSADFSDDFDVSKVTVKDRPDVNLLSSVLAAVSFLRAYRPPNSSAPQTSAKRPPLSSHSGSRAVRESRWRLALRSLSDRKHAHHRSDDSAVAIWLREKSGARGKMTFIDYGLT